jgi:hypothetical protein
MVSEPVIKNSRALFVECRAFPRHRLWWNGSLPLLVMIKLLHKSLAVSDLDPPPFNSSGISSPFIPNDKIPVAQHFFPVEGGRIDLQEKNLTNYQYGLY